MFKNWKIFLAGVLSVHLFLLFKLKFTAWPEMLLWPYLITKGWLPYVNIAIAHTPHLFIDLSFFYKIFGTGVLQLQIFTWILIILTDIVLFLVVKKLKNIKVAAISLVIYVFWQIFFDGNGLWFDLMLAPFAILAFYLVEKKKYFWTGAAWVIMFFTKQTAVWFLIPIAFEIFRSSRQKIKSFVSLAVGVLGIGTLAIFALFAFGALPDFWNWAVKFGIFILPKAQGQIQLPYLKTLMAAGFPFLIFLPLIRKTKSKNINLLVWAIVGAMGAYPRFEYFHFQPAIPFLAVASGLVFSGIKKFKGIWKIFIIVYLIGSLYLFANFFLRNWGEGIRFYEQDVRDVASYVKQNSTKEDKIFVMNWWDSIYALSDTLPATDPWVPQLSWYQELPGVQDGEVADLKNSKPKLILLRPYEDSGLASYVPQKVFDYVSANYRLKEKIDGIEILIRK